MKRFLSPLVRFFALSALILLCLGLIVPLFMAGTTAGTTGPKIWVQDSQPLPVNYVGPGAPAGTGIAAPQPVAMIDGDFDHDGVNDLAVGFAGAGGGLIAIHRGNLDAFAPQSEASFQAIAHSQFLSPFLPQAKTFNVPVSPDFIATGDFTGHNNTDLAVASRGGSTIYIFEGNGKGDFTPGQTIPLPGGVTSLAGGVLGKIQAFSKLMVGVSSPQQTFLAVYGGGQPGQQGMAPLAAFPLSAPATSISFGEFGDIGPDAAFLSGGQVMLLHSSSMQLETLSLPVNAQAMALGSFVYDRMPGLQIALLDSNGTIAIAAHNEFDPRVFTVDEMRSIRQSQRNALPNPLIVHPFVATNGWKIVESVPSAATFNSSQPPVLLRTRISNQGADDVMAISPSAGQLAVFSHPDPVPGTSTFVPGALSTRPYSGSPVAAISARVNVDGRPGVLALHQGEMAPRVMMPLPDPVFNVNTTNDGVFPGSCAAATANQCTLREALIEANGDTVMVPNGTYTLTIAKVANDCTGKFGALSAEHSVTIVGGGQATTIIQAGATQAAGVDMVMNVNEDLGTANCPHTNATASLSNLTLQNGHNNGTHGNDGDGGCMEFDTGTSGNTTLTLTNVTLNNCTTTQGNGGGIAIFNFIVTSGTGAVTISNSIIQGNSANDSVSAGTGGGIWVSQSARLTMSNSQVLNNTANNATTDGGGGITTTNRNAPPSPTITIHASTISGNHSAGSGGGGIHNETNLIVDQGTVISGNTTTSSSNGGGGIYSNTKSPDAVTLTKVTITGNSAANGLGGGIFHGNNSAGVGGLTMTFSRLAGNSASTAASKNLENDRTTITATNNWWGTNTPTNTIANENGGTTTFDPFIVLTHTASPNKIRINQSSTLTADMSKDNHGVGTALAGNLDEIVGLPITFNNAVLGTIPQPQPEALGNPVPTATATYNAGGVGGNGSADATVDQQTVTAPIIVLQPPTMTKSFNPTAVAENTPSTLTFSLTNGNTVTINASFTDTLPTGLVVATTPSVVDNCTGGSVTATAASGTISYNNPSSQQVGTCTVQVNVQSAVDNTYANSVTLDSSDAGNATAPSTASLTVINPPTIAKAFGAATIPLNGTTSLTFTLSSTNTNLTLNGVAFTDSLPAGLLVATPSGLTSNCTGTATATAGSGTVSLSGASLAPGASCTVALNVQGTTAGVKSNSVTVSDTIAGNGNTSTANITVVAPPVIIKAFGAASIPLNGSTTLQFTIQNNNLTQSLSGVAFSDTFPAGLVVSTPNGLTGNTCVATPTATAGTNVVSLTGATIAANSSCTFTINVTGTAAGQQNNTTGNVTSTEGGTGGTASASVTVVAPPSIAKAFNPNAVPLNGTTSLTFTITNPAANTTAENGVAFSDTLPAGLVVATPNGLINSCGGTATATAGSTSISLTGGSIAVNTSCTVVVNVTGTVAGQYTNTSGAVSSTNGGTGNTASASLTVASPPSIAKAFGALTTPLGGSTSLTFTITNPNTVALTGVAFTDNLPSGLVVATPPGTTNSCNGAVTAAAGSSSISLTGGTVGASANCTVMVNVTGTTAGTKNNTTGAVSATEGGTGNTANASITVVLPPTILKAFSPNSINITQTSTLTFTITNPNSAIGFSAVAFSDTLPTGLTVADSTGAACGGTLTTTAATGVIALSGGVIAASSQCTIPVTVTGAQDGVWVNVSGAVTSAEGGTGNTATDTLTVGPQPAFSKAFAALTVPLNGNTTLTFTIHNGTTITPLTNLQFTDSLPTGLQIAVTDNLISDCSSNPTPNASVSTPGTVMLDKVAVPNTISLAGLGLTNTNGGSCTISVDVTGTIAGHVTNNVTISSTEGGNPGPTATASIDVVAPPSIAKAFNPSTIALNGTSALTFTITNPPVNAVAENGVAFTDTLPAGLTVADSSATVCGGTLTTTSATGVISLTGASVAKAGQCQFSVTVTGATAGPYTNTSGSVSSTNGGTGNTASANLTVVAPPTITKVFGATAIPLNGATSLTFNITNPNSFSGLTGVGFSDSLPSGLVVATPPGLTNSCGGSVSASAGSGTITLSTVSLGNSGSCTLSVNVQGTTAGIKNNSVQVTSTEGGTGNVSNASITVVAPPVIIKAFGAASIPLNGSTSLTFTIQNNNAGNTLSGIAFSDTLPAGLVISTPNGLAGSCGGGTITATQATNVISLSGATLPQSTQCQFSINVTGTAPGTQNNTTGQVTSTEGGTGGTASASVNVVAPPSIAKAFTPNAIALNATTSLTFTITNPAVNAVALTGVAFTDTLPTGLTVPNASAGVCGGTLTLTAPTGIALSGATIATNSQCQFSVTVTGAASGAYTNTTSAVTSTNGGTGNTASASLVVGTPQTVTKSFGATQIPLNGITSLTFNISNPNASTTLTGLTFTDSLPSGLQVASPNGLTNSCGGTATATVASGQVSLTGGTLAASSSCSLSVNVQGTTAGIKNNSVTVTSNEGGSSTANATLTVVAPPVIIKAFGAATVPLNGSTSLTFTIQNNNAGNTLSGIAFSDTLPAGLVISTPNGLTGSCGGGTITATQATNVISLSGATLAQSTQCQFSVNVTGIAAGTQNNTTGPVTSTEGGTGGTASASLAVVAPPAIEKFFLPGGIQPNGVSTLTITITNPASNNTVAATGVAFTDNFPANLVVATPNGLSNNCGGPALATSGSGIVSLSGGSIAVNTACQVTVNVTSSFTGSYLNTSGSVSSDNGGTGGTASATLVVANPPTISKLFVPATTVQNGTSLLSFTITNPNSNSTLPNNDVTITGITFTDALPAGLQVAASPSISNNCDGTVTAVPGSTSITLTGGDLAPAVGLITRRRASRAKALVTPSSAGQCFISVRVQATTQGTLNNTTGPISANESGPGAASNLATLTVTAPPSAPTLTKAFGAATILANGTTSLTFTMGNPAANSVSFTNISFNDPLPSGLVVASPNGVGGTCSADVVANPGSSSIAVANVVLPPNNTCTVVVNVTGTSLGTKNNTTSNVTATFDDGTGTFVPITGGTASASITLLSPIMTIAKSHSGNFTQGDVGDTYTITVGNIGNAPSSDTVTVTDTVPPALIPTAISGTGWTCTLGTLTCTRGDALAVSGSYPPITLTTSVAVNAPPSVVNTAVVTGGGETAITSATVTDSTTINQLPGPPLIIGLLVPTTQTIKSGQSAQFVFDVVSHSATLGNINFSCTGLPPGSACSFTPQTENQGDAQVTMTMTTTPDAGLVMPFGAGGGKSGPMYAALLFPVLGLVSLAAAGSRGKKNRMRLAMFLGSMIVLLALFGCGGSPHNGKGTPIGAFPITVTATSAANPTVTASTQVVVTVQ